MLTVKQNINPHELDITIIGEYVRKNEIQTHGGYSYNVFIKVYVWFSIQWRYNDFAESPKVAR